MRIRRGSNDISMTVMSIAICGFALAGQCEDAFLVRDCLGHRDIANSSICVATSPARFSKIRW